LQSMLHSRDAGVRDQDFAPAQTLDGGCKRLFNRIAAAHIYLDRDGAFPDLGGRTLRGLDVDICDGDTYAALRKRRGDGATYALCAAGDEGASALKLGVRRPVVAHARLALFWRLAAISTISKTKKCLSV
jgi:hypothetical protein